MKTDRQITGQAGHKAEPAPISTAENINPASGANPPGFLDVPGLLARLPFSERSLRTAIKKGRIPCIRLPGGRRLLFDWESVHRALLRFQSGDFND